MANESKPGKLEELPPDSPNQTSETVGTVLSEDLALAQLKDRELAADAIEDISQNVGLMRSRKVRMELAAHPRTPRRIALRLIRELYPFDLMRFALLPVVPADLRQVADQALLTRLPSITLGERISLARRGSGTIAGALLRDKESQVWQAALENLRLLEADVVKALRQADSPPFLEAVTRHAKWSLRVEVRAALSRTPDEAGVDGGDSTTAEVHTSPDND